MSHAHDAKIREKVRAKATELGGHLSMELRHHDIFHFPLGYVAQAQGDQPAPEDYTALHHFADWCRDEKHVKDVEYGLHGDGQCNNLIGVRYEK